MAFESSLQSQPKIRGLVQMIHPSQVGANRLNNPDLISESPPLQRQVQVLTLREGDQARNNSRPDKFYPKITETRNWHLRPTNQNTGLRNRCPHVSTLTTRISHHLPTVHRHNKNPLHTTSKLRPSDPLRFRVIGTDIAGTQDDCRVEGGNTERLVDFLVCWVRGHVREL